MPLRITAQATARTVRVKEAPIIPIVAVLRELIAEVAVEVRVVNAEKSGVFPIVKSFQDLVKLKLA